VPPTATSIPPSATPIPPTATPAPADLLFADGFESGGLSAWSASSGGTRISVGGAAALQGAYGMQAQIGGITPIYVQDNTPASERSYRARFAFHPNGARTGISEHDIFAGRNASGASIFRVQYRRTTAGAFQIRAGVLRSGGTSWTNWSSVTNAAHTVEIGWQSATSAAFALFLDGVVRGTLTGLNTSAYTLDSVRLGPSAGLGASMAGVEYYDTFVSTRGGAIGP
jgi:hypothetical protein